MVTVTYSLRDDYWDTFLLQEADIEYINNFLLELETPLNTQELVIALINERITRERKAIEEQRTTGGTLYQPKGTYKKNQTLVFPALNWLRGQVAEIRPGRNPDIGQFNVIQVDFDDGSQQEYASGLDNHILNEPPKISDKTEALNPQYVKEEHGQNLINLLDEYLESNPDYVRIAGRWFPRSLLVDISVGHLNLAEAVLDMADGGPLPTHNLLDQIELNSKVNPKLVEFSLDLALQEDQRFDEVGPAGDILWYLERLEPANVRKIPIFLKYHEIEYDRSILTGEMLALERDLDDELSPIGERSASLDEAEVRLIFPHWIAGTLPLSPGIRHLFPTAYEAPRIRFMLIDGETGEKIPGWVVREKRYIYGLKDWYETSDLIPGSFFRVRKGRKPGEVIIHAESRRSSREWIRTVLVGSDSGIVFAMLKQKISARFDDRMAIAVPDHDAIVNVWKVREKDRPPFERVVVQTVRELAKLNPQSHVHASELYAAVNIVQRCPPGPILALLASRPWFVHVGDLHYRLNDAETI